MPYLTKPIVVFGLTGSFAHITENRTNVGVSGNAIGQEGTYGSIFGGAGLGGAMGSGGGASGIGGPGGGGVDAFGGMGVGGQNAYQPPAGGPPNPPYPPTTAPAPTTPRLTPVPAFGGGGAGGHCPGKGNSMVKDALCHQRGTLLGIRYGCETCCPIPPPSSDPGVGGSSGGGFFNRQ